jgi:uracil-DNA glycosylase
MRALVGAAEPAYWSLTLGDTVKAWREHLPLGYVPLPHPSPRNLPWLVRKPWFEAELAPAPRNLIKAMKL